MYGNDLLTALGQRGIPARLVSLDHAENVRGQVRDLHSSGEVEDGLYKEWLHRYVDHPMPKNIRRARSVLVFSYPSPPLYASFWRDGRRIELVVPPTYHDYWESVSTVRRLMKETAGRSDCFVAKAVVPLKLIAVRSGIARYGRNNITYVEGQGSFHRLGAMYTDLEPEVDGLGPMRPLPKCETCRACVRACPAGAICSDRFLVRAERCITRYNERAADKPFPHWISPSWHNALQGCMICQRACPYNAKVLGLRKEGADFSEAETSYLLRGRFEGDKAKAMGRKLRKVGLELTVFPRNLKVLLSQGGRR